MNFEVNTSILAKDEDYGRKRAEELQQELVNLAAWKSKARIQLEYFRCACSLYKLCGTDEVNELLNN